MTCVSKHTSLSSAWFVNVTNAPPDPVSSIESLFGPCSGTLVSPPEYLVRVSSLTSSSTSYVSLQATPQKILPSPSLSSPTPLATDTLSFHPSSVDSKQQSPSISSQIPDETAVVKETTSTKVENGPSGNPNSPIQYTSKSIQATPAPELSVVFPPTEQASSRPSQTSGVGKVLPTNLSPSTNQASKAVYVNGQEITQGGASITENGKTVAYSSGSLYIDSSAMALPSVSNQVSDIPVISNGLTFSVIPQPDHTPSPSSSSSILTIQNSFVASASVSQLHTKSQSFVAGGASITISGTSVTSAPTATALVTGSSTESFSPESSFPAIVIGNQKLTANSAGQYLVASQTLIPGSLVTISGIPVSLLPSLSGIMIGSTTSSLSTSLQVAPTLTLGSSVYTANIVSAVTVNGQTLSPGSEITISGTRISLDTKGGAHTIGTDTQTAGLGALIMSAMGGTGASTTASMNLSILPTLSPLTADNLTLSLDVTKMMLSGTTYSVGLGATPTTVIVGNKTLKVGPSGVVFPSTTITVGSTTNTSAYGFTGGASSSYQAKSMLISILATTCVLIIKEMMAI